MNLRVISAPFLLSLTSIMKVILVLTFFISAVLCQETLDCDCGIERLSTRIINGREAQKQRYPWMASVMVPQGGNSYASCGGSLISDRYIMTAAHCVKGVSQAMNPKYKVVLDAHSREDRQRLPSLEVEKVIPHTGWSTGENDIALIKLKNPVDLKKHSPVCLPNFKKYENLFVTGWGMVNKGDSLSAATSLNEVDLKEVPQDSCRRRFNVREEKQICAGGETGSCRGDSGGPLSTRKDGHVYQVGIVSFGSPDCSTKTKLPNVYERVTGQMDWIKENTKDAKFCRAPEQAVGDGDKNKDSSGTGGKGGNNNDNKGKKDKENERKGKIEVRRGGKNSTESRRQSPPENKIESIKEKNGRKVTSCECGREGISTRIRHGVTAQSSRYPWVASIITSEEKSCGGSLINDRFILTSANCVKGKNPNQLKVAFSAQTESDRTASSKLVKIGKVHAHPAASPESEINNIALLELESPVQISNRSPICLPPASWGPNPPVRTGSTVFLTGYGKTGKDDGKYGAKSLQEVTVPYLNGLWCLMHYGTWNTVKQLCAGCATGASVGDGGSPLSVRLNGHVYQMGIVSFGMNGGDSKEIIPDVYERVTGHLDWIRETTKDALYCDSPELQA